MIENDNARVRERSRILGTPTDSAAQGEIRSEELFGEAREIVILHKGMRYRLIRTKQGKLILNK